MTHNIWFVMSYSVDTARWAARWYLFILAGVAIWALLALGATGVLYLVAEWENATHHAALRGNA